MLKILTELKITISLSFLIAFIFILFLAKSGQFDQAAFNMWLFKHLFQLIEHLGQGDKLLHLCQHHNLLTKNQVCHNAQMQLY